MDIRELIEYLDSPDSHQFSADEMAACGEHGDCCQCGLCCVVFYNEVPERVPTRVDEITGMVAKQCMVPCPHLARTNDGRMGCACHEAKDHPKLRQCRDWRGDEFDQYSGTKFWRMHVVAIRKLLMNPGNEDELTDKIWILEKLIAKGIFSKELDLGEYWFRQIKPFLKACIKAGEKYGALPHNIFQKMNLQKLIGEILETEFAFALMMDLGIDTGNPLHREFIDKYLGTKI